MFIDEISMVGANKLQRVHESLSNMQNKKKAMPFGGVSVICFGDLKQVSLTIFFLSCYLCFSQASSGKRSANI